VPRLGCINIHASLLPRWRGAAPIQRALLAGDSMTGVTIMRMEAGLDTGPMLGARRDWRRTIRRKTVHDGWPPGRGTHRRDTLDALEDGDVRESAATRRRRDLCRESQQIRGADRLAQDAAQVMRRVRAFNPWPIAETRWNGAQLRVWDAEVMEAGVGQPDGANRPRLWAPGSVVRPPAPASTSPAVAVCCASSLQLAGPQAAGGSGIHQGTAARRARASPAS
jgi:methionyl-tRNA formyltransferase